MSEVVAFSTHGIDTHNAYHNGVHSSLLKLLHKLNIGLESKYPVYVVPVSGYYQVSSGNSRVCTTNSIQRFAAGDSIKVDMPQFSIHRVGG